MKIPLYVVDAFTNRRFGSNPAAVCPLPEWLDDDLMQAIAAENNLSETAFFVKSGNSYELRCLFAGERVQIGGQAVLFSQGEIRL